MTDGKIEPLMKAIAGLAQITTDRNWATEILARCAQMRSCLEEAEKIARSREAGER